MPKISIVIPVFNEENNIKLLFNDLIINLNNVGLTYEIIFIDDGSKDNSVSILEQLVNEHDFVKYAVLSRNFGHQSALKAGLDIANGDAVITMDCDLQDPAYIVPQLIEEWKKGGEVVYARRKNFRKDNFLKKFATKLHYKLLGRFTEIRIPKNVGDFRLIDRKVLNHLLSLNETTGYIRGMIAWVGFKNSFVDYTRPDRKHGKAGYTFSKLFHLAMEGLLSFSLLPLKFGLIIGLVSIFIGSIFMIYMIGDIIINGVYYQLYKFLVDIIFIFMGLLFIFIWILGEYIGRIFRENKRRPSYIIRYSKNID